MLKNQIAYAQLKFHPHSFADPDGRLFWLDGALYRAISYEKTSFFARLFENGTIPELINRGLLVRSEPTDFALDGYGMVLRHTVVPFVSYPNEWCAAMFKDAALAYLDLLEQLIPRGLTLKDTHPWNLLFEGTRPVYVDITSITDLTSRYNCPDYTKFCRYYLYPLVLMSRGQERIARYLLPDYEGIRESDFLLLTRGASPTGSTTGRLEWHLLRGLRRSRSLLSTVANLVQPGRQAQAASVSKRLGRLGGIRRQIEDVAAPSAPREYEEGLNTQTQQYLERVISQLGPVSILAVGVKSLWYSGLAARLGSRIVVFDTDATYITKLYIEARRQNLPVLPVVMDFTDATPSRGLPNHVSIAAAERFQCELVLALGLLNTTKVERHLRFDQLVEGLAQFSKKWLIIDYTRQDVPKEAERQSGSCEDTPENLTRALAKRFRNVSSLQSDSKSHNLLLCEK